MLACGTVAVALQPLRQRLVGDGHGHLGRLLGGVGLCVRVVRDGVEHSLAQVGTELQLIKTRGHLAGHRSLESQIRRSNLQVHVRNHLRELAVELDLLDAVTEVLARQTLDFLRVLDEPIEGTVLGNPLGGGLFPYFRNGGKVI